VERSGERLEVRVTPAPSGPDGSGRIGIQLAANADVVQRRGEGPAQALGLALEQYVTLTNTVLKGGWAGWMAGVLAQVLCWIGVSWGNEEAAPPAATAG
jgi:hypothetical protein